MTPSCQISSVLKCLQFRPPKACIHTRSFIDWLFNTTWLHWLNANILPGSSQTSLPGSSPASLPGSSSWYCRQHKLGRNLVRCHERPSPHPHSVFSKCSAHRRESLFSTSSTSSLIMASSSRRSISVFRESVGAGRGGEGGMERGGRGGEGREACDIGQNSEGSHQQVLYLQL